jgi:hypothetical protein
VDRQAATSAKKKTGANFVVTGSFHTKFSLLALQKTNLYSTTVCTVCSYCLLF